MTDETPTAPGDPASPTPDDEPVPPPPQPPAYVPPPAAPGYSPGYPPPPPPAYVPPPAAPGYPPGYPPPPPGQSAPGYPPSYPPPGPSTPGYPPSPQPPPYAPESTIPSGPSNPYGPAGPWGQPAYGYNATPGYAQPGPYGYPNGYQGADPRQRPVDAFGRPLADWWPRAGALLIDALVVGVPGAIVAAIVAAATSTTVVGPTGALTSTSSGWANTIVGAFILAIQFLYFAILDGQSQTLGKRAVGIAVRDQASGQAIGFGRALGRWLIYSVLWYLLIIPGLLNTLSPLWDQRRQAWHDHAVGSVVVSVR